MIKVPGSVGLIQHENYQNSAQIGKGMAPSFAYLQRGTRFYNNKTLYEVGPISLASEISERGTKEGQHFSIKGNPHSSSAFSVRNQAKVSEILQDYGEFDKEKGGCQ